MIGCSALNKVQKMRIVVAHEGHPNSQRPLSPNCSKCLGISCKMHGTRDNVSLIHRKNRLENARGRCRGRSFDLLERRALRNGGLNIYM